MEDRKKLSQQIMIWHNLIKIHLSVAGETVKYKYQNRQ